MAHESSDLPYLRELLIFLALAGVLIPLLRRLRVSPVFGFLVVGAVLGPFGLGSLADASPWIAWASFPRLEGVIGLAELGILFLMFSIGLELSLERLNSMRRWVVGAGSAQMLLTGAVIGALALTFGNPAPAALLIGASLAFSSTALVMQLLAERRENATRHGRAAFGVLLFQDLAVVPVAILASVLSEHESSLWTTAALALLKGVVAIVLIYQIGKRLIRPVFRGVIAPGQSDSFFALTLLATLGTAALTSWAGLSMALGAFLAGLLLSETEYRHEIESIIEPFKGLLLGLFFFTVGMGFDFRALVREPVWLPLSVLGLFAIKTLILVPILRVAGLDWRRALATGALLGQAGEFGFVIVAAGTLTGVIPREVGQFMLLIIGLSLLATPVVDRLGRAVGTQLFRGGRTLSPAAEPAAPALPEIDGHIVMAGYGRVGRTLGRLFEQGKIPFVAVESDAEVAGAARDQGLPVHFGDASRPDLLRRFHVERAAAVVVTMNHPAHALRTVKALRRQFPKLRILARAHDRAHAARLREAGADAVVPETLESTLYLGRLVFETIGIDAPLAQTLIDEERQRFAGYTR